MKKPDIDIVVVIKGGQYEAGNGKIERIGDKKGKQVTWNITNDASGPIHVKIHKFPQGSCPIQKGGDFTNCEYDTQAKGNSAFKKGETRKLKAKLANCPGLYTYEFYVSDPQTGVGNPVDPELQIDDVGLLDHLKPVLVTIGLIGALTYVYRRFKS